MTPEALFEKVSTLADRVVADKRWQEQNDDIGVTVLGMLLYGYALGFGRLILMLDIEDINAVVTRILVERVGAAAKWSSGLVDEAARSAFDEKNHPVEHGLIGAGHQYMTESKLGKLVGNVFANIESMRRQAEA
jgi:hypothetical protein